jgi:hypothetical protein
VKVISGEAAFWHTATVPEIIAVGSGLTVMVADPAWFCEQGVVPDPCTFISVTMTVPGTAVGMLSITLLPAVVVIVWEGFPFML